MADDDLPEGLGMLTGLRHKLEELPDNTFLAVIDQLEIMSELPPVIEVISEARPRLRVLKPHRPRSLKRPLCLPFEDLLSLQSADLDDAGIIGRDVIAPLWRHLEAYDRPALDGLQREFKRTGANEPSQLLDIGERLWQLAARALSKSAPPEINSAPAIMLRDILAAASEIQAFKRAVPRKPVLNFGDAERGLIKEQLQSLLEKNLPNQGYLYILAVRLDAPSDLLRWLRDLGLAVPPVVERFALGKLTGQIDRFEHQAIELAPSNWPSVPWSF